MLKPINISPLVNELPSQFAERLGNIYASTVTSSHKKHKGQFFTPVEIARFMGKLSTYEDKNVSILDPGCGTAILSVSLIEHLAEKDNVEQINLTLYETDEGILPYTLASVKYLEDWLFEKNIKLTSVLIAKDFVIENRDFFDNHDDLFKNVQRGLFDIVISNPPYFKISKDDKRAIVAKQAVYGQPNIYSIFLITSAKLLKKGGELIFITPRSFTSGNYFRAFREMFFEMIQIHNIHLFGSRTDTFSRDKVLQETLIIRGEKESLISDKINLTHSVGISDLANAQNKEYDTAQLIDLSSKEKILHLPVTDFEEDVINLFKSWKGSLKSFDMQISTGPVVSFRAKDFLFQEYRNGTVQLVPLYQLYNTAKMQFEWPVVKNNKPQYIQLADNTRSLLTANKNYIFLRRFSAKDDKSRLIATPYLSGNSPSAYIGIENHLNYIYRPKGDLELNEIIGLSALLNSLLFDTYFRTFNGNINVSATELREMPLPPLENIKQLGDILIRENNYTMERIDELVNEYFAVENAYHE